MKKCIYLLIIASLFSCGTKPLRSPSEVNSFENVENENCILENIDNEEEPVNFAEYIKITNCTISNDYFVPNQLTIVFGLEDDDPPGGSIKKNMLRGFWGGFFVILKNDIPLNEDIVIIAKNNKHEFGRMLNLEPIISHDNNDILGYYEKIIFEDKFWLSDGNNWRFIVKSDNNILIDEELWQISVSSMLFDELDESPFVVNDLSKVNLYNEYTYRCRKRETNIIVIYYKFDYLIYKPVMYLIPEKNETLEYIDIGICWDDEKARGVYLFRNYRIDELPTEEETLIFFDSIEVK